VTSCGKIFSAMNYTKPGDCIFVFKGITDRFWTLRPMGDGTFRLVGDLFIPEYQQEGSYELQESVVEYQVDREGDDDIRIV
jgi:hypothetical protein